MHKSSRKRLIDIVDFTRIELDDLKAYDNLDYHLYSQNRNTRRLVEKIIENVTNAIIDILKILIGENGLKMPESYAEIMITGSGIFKLEEEQTTQLVQISKLRNILAHEYLDLKWSRIKSFLTVEKKIIDIILEKTESLIAEDIKSDPV